MKRSPTRQRLLKYQEYLREQKAANARLEEEVHAMGDRMDALKDAIAHTEEQLRALHDRFEAERPEDSDGMQNYIQETQRLLQNVSGYEQEVRRIRKDVAAFRRGTFRARWHAGGMRKLRQAVDPAVI